MIPSGLLKFPGSPIAETRFCRTTTGLVHGFGPQSYRIKPGCQSPKPEERQRRLLNPTCLSPAALKQDPNPKAPCNLQTRQQKKQVKGPAEPQHPRPRSSRGCDKGLLVTGSVRSDAFSESAVSDGSRQLSNLQPNIY